MVDYPPTPQSGTFPPSGPTTLTEVIPSYVYKQFDDDDDVQAFVRSYNELAQVYATWFATVALPVYTGAAISGALLDWVAAGIYGQLRPRLSSGRFRAEGPYNTYAFNTWPFNKLRIIGPSDVAVTTDDIFKRIITWNFYKGDGDTFNVRWLKRRIMRFLTGADGTAPNVPQTYPISVTIGNNIVSIRVSGGSRRVLSGALFNRHRFNQRLITFDALITEFVPGPDPLPNESVLKEAIEAGVLQLPFQYRFIVTVSG